MRRIVPASIVIAALAAAVVLTRGEAAPRLAVAPASPGPMLALANGPRSSALMRVDPESLRPVGSRRLSIGYAGYAWSFSPDRSRLALGGDRNGRFVPDLLLVDAARLRSLGRVQLRASGWVVATAWLSGGHVAAVVASTGVDVVTVDVARRRVAANRRFEGQLVHAAHTADGLVLLLSPDRAIGPARLVVVRASGAFDVVTLDSVVAGTSGTGGSAARSFQPGLAVDAAGHRAYVTPAAGDVAVVGLDDLDVEYHAVSEQRSLASRLSRWLQPVAHAKAIAGPARHARWLGGGLIAVSGGDYAVNAQGRPTFTPAGVRLIDTRDWTSRSFAAGADSFKLAGDVLLATASTWSSELVLPAGVGVRAYRLDGRERFRHLDGERAWIVHADARRAYVDPYGPGPVRVIDVATGEVVERRASVARPLAGPGEPAL